jgi:hypothetical protein
MALGGCWVGSVVWIGFPAMTTNLVGLTADALPAVAQVELSPAEARRGMARLVSGGAADLDDLVCPVCKDNRAALAARFAWGRPGGRVQRGGGLNLRGRRAAHRGPVGSASVEVAEHSICVAGRMRCGLSRFARTHPGRAPRPLLTAVWVFVELWVAWKAPSLVRGTSPSSRSTWLGFRRSLC